MADKMDATNLEAEFKALKLKGKLLQRTLSDVSCEYGAFMKQYNEANDRMLIESIKSPDTGRSTDWETQSKNAVVVMLIDASSHKFCDELFDKKVPRGSEASVLLRNALCEKLKAKFPDLAHSKYCLVIRIFASLEMLSMTTATSDKSTSLAGFLADFGRVGTFFDLVVTPDDRGIKNKICGNLKLYTASEQCKHVFLAAAGSPWYHQALEPYRGQTSKITLVFGNGLDSGLRKMGLLLVSFPAVFEPPPKFKIKSGSTTNGTKPMEKLGAKSETDATPGEHADTNAKTTDVNCTEKALWSPLFSFQLPACYIGGRIPINSAKQRIDIYVRAPTTKEFKSYDARSKVQYHLCIDYFLRNKCGDVNCEFYHGTLEPEVHYVLQHTTMGTACSKGSVCRIANCAYGHICQRGECGRAGKRVEGCRLPGSMHGLDTKVAEWVSPDEDNVRPRVPAQSSTALATGAYAGGGVALSIEEDLLG
ncbi:hypothetical protein J4E93_009997 [Alternaria ventricosa]|uniref:uncharacterized protein n=1 Tax=Alternaria ventricosa TaxID=1187951 RepID=UPI0020C4FF0A|nr:uncharacterized protein J4E93_009997 [Alternaria ventricosa]KAI4638444.1 hypothetical protein J4E93_009997 [Alternaria ventricosa]